MRNLTLSQILDKIDDINSMCNYDCYYYDCDIDCSHTECYKDRVININILDKELFKWLSCVIPAWSRA